MRWFSAAVALRLIIVEFMVLETTISSCALRRRRGKMFYIIGCEVRDSIILLWGTYCNRVVQDQLLWCGYYDNLVTYSEFD